VTQNLPEGMPVPKVPIDVQVVADAADEYGVSRADLVATLEDIDAYLVDNARDVHARTTGELGKEALVFEGVHFAVLYVDPDEWIELRVELDLGEDVWWAAKTSHAGETERIVGAIDRLEFVDELATNDLLVTPTPIVGDLVDAGLSHRQAAIQALRMEGDSQERIGEKMGIATGTVKSHCDRIDRKIERARRLLELVESDSA